MMVSEFVFSYLKKRIEAGDSEFGKSYIRHLQTFAYKYSRYQLLLKFLDRLVSLIHQPSRIDIFFIGTKFLDLIIEVSRYRNVMIIVVGKTDLKNVIKNIKNIIKYKIPFLSGSKWLSDLFWAYKEPRSDLQEKKLQQIISEIQNMLEYWKPSVIVLWNDSLFLERAIIYAAKKCNIPSVTIQDGLFMSSSEPSIIHGHYSDYMLVWGEFFKNLFISCDIKSSDKIYVLGYPFKISKDDIQHKASYINKNRNKLKACFFGQPFEKYNRDYLHMKYSVVQNVLQACKKLNITFSIDPILGKIEKR